MKIGTLITTTSPWVVAGAATATTIIVSLWLRYFLQNKLYQNSTPKAKGEKGKEENEEWENSSLWIKAALNKSEIRQVTGAGAVPISTVSWFTTTTNTQTQPPPTTNTKSTTTNTATSNSTPLSVTKSDKDNGDALTQVATIIQDRLEAIVQANPWLCGRILKHTETGKYFLVYANPKTQKDQSSTTLKQNVTGLDLFHYVKTPPTGFGPNTNDPVNACKPFLLKHRCDLSQPFIKVCFIPSCGTSMTTLKNVPSDSSSSSFALTVSMSHVVGDGYTFYTIHNMLAGAIPIRSLNPVRVENTEEHQCALIGKAEYSLSTSSGSIVSYLRGLLFASVSSALRKILLLGTKKDKERKPRCFLVDQTKMEQLKQEAVANDPKVSFVSSNDVITSWFLHNCGARTNTFMAFDVRNRAHGHTKDHAGNYFAFLYYDATLDAATPALIRRSLKTWKRVVTTTLPSPLSWGLFGSSALVTSWASHHSAKVDFSVSSSGSTGVQVKPLLHLPLIELQVPPTFTMCLIFQARPNQLAVCIYDGSCKPGLQRAPFEKIALDNDAEGTLFGMTKEM